MKVLPVWYEEPMQIVGFESKYIKDKSVIQHINRYTVGNPDSRVSELMQIKNKFIPRLILSFVLPNNRLICGITRWFVKWFGSDTLLKYLKDLNISSYHKSVSEGYSLIFECNTEEIIDKIITLSNDFFLLPFIFLVQKEESKLFLLDMNKIITDISLWKLEKLEDFLTKDCLCIFRAMTTDPYLEIITKEIKKEDVESILTNVCFQYNAKVQIMKAEW